MGNGDSRTLFRDQVHQVLNSELTFSSADTWSGLFLFPENLEDVLSMFPVSDVKVLLSRRPQNFQVVVDKALEILEVFKDPEDQDFPLAINAARLLIRVVAVTLTQDFWWGRERRAQRLLSALIYYELELAQRSSALDIQRLLLVTLCGKLCQPGLVRDPKSDLWRWVLCSGSYPTTENLFEKLLVGAVEPVAVSRWPHSQAKAAVCLREVSLHVLLALVDFEPFKPQQIPEDHTLQNLIEHSELLPVNVFSERFAVFDKAEWLLLATQGLLSGLRNYTQVQNSLLPGSTLELPFHCELLLLLYQLLTRNAGFAAYFSRDPNAREVVQPVLQLVATAGDEGVSGAGAVCLLRLCAFDHFTAALKVPFTNRDPQPWPLFTGSYADLLVIGICHILLETQTLVLREHFAGILSNACGLLRASSLSDLSLVAGMQVGLAIATLSVKTWLFSSPDHYRPLELLLQFCRIQVGRSPEFTKSIASRAYVLDTVYKLKAPLCDPEPPEDLNWQPSMQWLSRLKVSLGLQDLLGQLENGQMASLQLRVFAETKHIKALVSRSFWNRLGEKLKPVFEGLTRI